MTVAGDPGRLRFLLSRSAKKYSRLRWISKARIAASYDFRARSGISWLQYVLWDPELDNYSYANRNDSEILRSLAELCSFSETSFMSYADELRGDAEFSAMLKHAARGRLEVKRRFEYGWRLYWYVIIRSAKPSTVVECGVKDGLGSSVILRALEKNDREGSPGILISFDLTAHRGWLVPDSLRARWDFRVADTQTALPEALEGSKVGVLIHDSDPAYASEMHELRAALVHAGKTLTCFSHAHWSRALHDLCGLEHGKYLEVAEEPIHPFYVGAVLSVGRFDRDKRDEVAAHTIML